VHTEACTLLVATDEGMADQMTAIPGKLGSTIRTPRKLPQNSGRSQTGTSPHNFTFCHQVGQVGRIFDEVLMSERCFVEDPWLDGNRSEFKTDIRSTWCIYSATAVNQSINQSINIRWGADFALNLLSDGLSFWSLFLSISISTLVSRIQHRRSI
jgi:hypothetical protein